MVTVATYAGGGGGGEDIMIATLYEVHWRYVVFFFVPFPPLTGSSQGRKVAFSRGQQQSCDSVYFAVKVS
jgi:hypothetical protein